MNPTEASAQPAITRGDAPIIDIDRISVHFQLAGGGLFSGPAPVLRAVEDVSLAIRPGETLALVGESGSGKSTLGQIIVRLTEPTAGRLFYRDADVAALSAAERHAFRHRVQMVFQDTNSSLNPRKRIRRALSEALKARDASNPQSASAVQAEMAELMAQVGPIRGCGNISFQADTFPPYQRSWSRQKAAQ